jgi:hypothetical protein
MLATGPQTTTATTTITAVSIQMTIVAVISSTPLIAGIVGGAVGLLLLIGIIALVVCVKRRSGRDVEAPPAVMKCLSFDIECVDSRLFIAVTTNSTYGPVLEVEEFKSTRVGSQRDLSSGICTRAFVWIHSYSGISSSIRIRQCARSIE